MSHSVNFINYNQNGTCISLGTSQGYRIFNCDPFGKYYSNTEGGCGIVEMLFSTSLLAVVGLGDQPTMSPRRVRIINTKRHSTICELTFASTILSVKLNRSRLVVLLEEQIYVYDINNMKLIHQIETSANKKGLMCLSPNLEHNYLAYPSLPRAISSDIKDHATTNNMHISSSPVTTPNPPHGRVTVKNGDVIIFNATTLQPSIVIEAHKGPIAAMGMSKDGTLLATASERGTIIRIFCVETGDKVYQFRRGTYATKIYSICFSEDNRFVAASSANETVHVFKLGCADDETSLEQPLPQQPQMVAMATTPTENSLPQQPSVVAMATASPIAIAGARGAPPLRRNSTEDSDDEYDDNDSALSEPVSFESGSVGEPLVDKSRKTMARMIRKSSLKFSRRAAETLGQYLPIKVSSFIEPSRHFASLKIPTTQGVQSVVSLAPETVMSRSELSQDCDYDTEEVKVLPIRVVTSEGFLYNYVLDPERGGDCMLLSQYSLLE